jgi:hypothetical protein
MCPPPEEETKTPEVNLPAEGEAAQPTTAGGDSAVSAEAKPCQGCAPAEPTGFRPHVLVYTGVSLMVILFSLWIVFTWSGYSDKYAQVTEGWSLGSTKMIEVTLIKEDRDTLSCASDLSFEGNRCAFAKNGSPVAGVDDAHRLQPFNTVKNELFIASNLWTSLGLKELPKERFSAVCNYRVLGVAKNLSLRWSKTAAFDPLKHSVAVGTLSNCVIPQ